VADKGGGGNLKGRRREVVEAGKQRQGGRGRQGGGDARDLSAMEGWLAAEGVKQGGVGRRTESRGWAPM